MCREAGMCAYKYTPMVKYKYITCKGAGKAIE